VKLRGQAATEYILSYGWVAMIVILVAVVLWYLGIFEPRVGYSFTSTEFGALKPLIASCSVGTNNWAGSVNGITCTFSNGAGDKVFIRNVEVEVTKLGLATQKCYLGLAATKTGGPGVANNWYVMKYNSAVPITCGYNGPGFACSDPFNTGRQEWMPVEKSENFVVMGLGDNSQGPPKNNCYDLKPLDRFTAKIDIEYAVDIGGVLGVKHAVGTVRNS
jgi:hypothetical protein